MMGCDYGDEAQSETRELEGARRHLLVTAGVALFVLLLLLRMIAFVAGHGRHHY